MNINMPERNSRFQPPPHRRKTPSFSSSLLDSILRSIDETNDGGLNEQVHSHDHDNIQDIVFFASEQKRTPETHLINEVEQIPSLRRAIMIDQWMETQNNNNNRNGYVSRKNCSRKFSSDSSSSGTTSSETETPSTYRSLPNSFTISRKTVEAISPVFCDDTQKHSSSSTKHGTKFMKSTKLRAMKIYGDLKKVKQPMSPGSRISTFLYSLFSKKAKMEETMQNLRTLKKSRSIKQDATTTTCSSFSRSCMSKKQHNNGVKRSVRFFPENETVIFDRSSNLMPTKYEKRWFTEKNYVKNYKNFTVNMEDDDEDEDEDDLFELEIVGGVGTCVYGQELPVFETTDLRRIRI